MEKLNYNRLQKITQTEKPYRGRSTVDYPVLERKHGYKYFMPRQDGTDTVFDIVYHHTYEKVVVISAEHERDARANKYTIHEDVGSSKYYYREIPNIMGVVRPDNTFEFTTNSLHQGSAGFLSQTFGYDKRGFINTSSRHGGMVMKTWGSLDRVFHPVFKGLRLDTTTLQPHESSRYEVNGYRVNRGAAKEFMARYEHMFKVCEVMMKTMEQQSFYRTVLEVVMEAYPSAETMFQDRYGYARLPDDVRDKFREKADAMIASAPLDSFILYGFISNANTPLSPHTLKTAYNRLFKNGNPSYYDGMRDPILVYDALRRRFSKDTYTANPEVMKKVRYESGKAYPASHWGVSILVNNQEVEQY